MYKGLSSYLLGSCSVIFLGFTSEMIWMDIGWNWTCGESGMVHQETELLIGSKSQVEVLWLNGLHFLFMAYLMSKVKDLSNQVFKSTGHEDTGWLSASFGISTLSEVSLASGWAEDDTGSGVAGDNFTSCWLSCSGFFSGGCLGWHSKSKLL